MIAPHAELDADLLSLLTVGSASNLKPTDVLVFSSTRSTVLLALSFPVSVDEDRLKVERRQTGPKNKIFNGS